MHSVAETIASDYVLSLCIYLILGLYIFITVLSGTTDILLQLEVYSAVNLTEWKLVCKFSHMYKELYLY